jgi:hypothetical protein
MMASRTALPTPHSVGQPATGQSQIEEIRSDIKSKRAALFALQALPVKSPDVEDQISSIRYDIRSMTRQVSDLLKSYKIHDTGDHRGNVQFHDTRH